MQEQMTNLENIVNSSIIEIRQKMLSICRNEYKSELNYQRATSFIDQVKGLISDLGCQVAKGYFESRDDKKDYIDLGNTRYLCKGTSTKEVATSLGRIGITRSYYQHRSGGNSLFPLDEKLGVKGEIMMPDVKEIVLYSCAFNTPEESSRMLEKSSFIKLHPTQIKRAVKSANKLIDAPSSDLMEKVRQREEALKADVLACSLDGVNVLLNQDGKKKGRPVERPVKEKQPSSAYKNAMCGSVSHYKLIDNQGEKEPIRISTKYIARMPEDYYPRFKHEFEEELKAGSLAATTKLVITDAHKSITGYLKNNPAFEGYHRIIDFYHASEHLSHMAEAIHGKSSESAKTWYLKYRDILKNQKEGVAKLTRSARYYLNSLPLNKSRKQEAKKHLGYFKRHKKFMDYAVYTENGWPIGSGVIEAACKSVVKQRMCRSGQRWSKEGGQAILNLRAIMKSERWDNFWEEFSQEYYTNRAA